MSDNQGFVTNSDGSITVELDGKKVKFVLESDLGAIKAASKDKDSEITKLQTSLAGANTKFDTEHQEFLKERAAREQFEKASGESATFKQQVEDLTQQMAGLKETSGKYETSLTERLRRSLAEGYKIDLEKIKDKGLSDLEQMEQTLVLTGYVPTPANYDGKGGGGTSTPDELQGKSPMTLAAMAYETSNKKK